MMMKKVLTKTITLITLLLNMFNRITQLNSKIKWEAWLNTDMMMIQNGKLQKAVGKGAKSSPNMLIFKI